MRMIKMLVGHAKGLSMKLYSKKANWCAVKSSRDINTGSY